MEKFIELSNEMRTVEEERRRLIAKMEKLESENQVLKSPELDNKIWNLEIKINDLDECYESISEERALSYEEYYSDKTNKDFVLYERCPNIGTLKLYLNILSSKFPLYDYGIFNACELAEIIKYMFQFETGDKCSILTLGTDSMDGEPINSTEIFSSNPHVYFVVGNDKTLSSFLNASGKFYNNNSLYNKLYMDAPAKNFASIELNFDSHNSMGMECLTGSDSDNKGMINYFDIAKQSYENFGIDKYKQIFSDDILHKINSMMFPEFSVVLDFKTSLRVTQILVSIAIYKRNNGIKDLTEEDYNHIFDVLYGKQVHIKEDIEKDIKRELIYVRNKVIKR